MSLVHRPVEERFAVALARALFIIALLTFLGWLSAKPAEPEPQAPRSDTP